MLSSSLNFLLFPLLFFLCLTFVSAQDVKTNSLTDTDFWSDYRNKTSSEVKPPPGAMNETDLSTHADVSSLKKHLIFRICSPTTPNSNVSVLCQYKEQIADSIEKMVVMLTTNPKVKESLIKVFGNNNQTAGQAFKAQLQLISKSDKPIQLDNHEKKTSRPARNRRRLSSRVRRLNRRNNQRSARRSHPSPPKDNSKENAIVLS